MHHIPTTDLLAPAPAFENFNESTTLEWPGNHVFLIPSDRYFEKIKTHYATILSTAELEKAKKFFRPEDQKRYVVRKHFLRKLLALISGTPADEIRFDLSGRKKPVVKDIPFNVSHSANLVAIVISTSIAGIDIEIIKQDFSYQMMLSDCFSKAEQMEIANAANPLRCFYTLWTRKEAILKASGAGLGNDNLRKVDVLLSRCTYEDRAYHLWSGLVSEHYVLSMAWTTSEKIYYWTI